jgi:predicted SnoaL-like aldol condensation-catalyzing enzyme
MNIMHRLAHTVASCTVTASALIAFTATAHTTPQPPAKPATVFSPRSADTVLERNKATVIAFYDLMFNQSKPAEAMRLYGGATYTQHNPDVPDGRDAFVEYFEKMAKDYPGKSVTFKRVFAEGEYVVLHSEHIFPGWRGGHWAAMDIFRLDAAGRLVEHWDALHKAPSTSVNGNGIF